MYQDHFRLNEMPFSIAPDPRFLFMSERHREAMAHLLYGVQSDGGIVVLTGEVGTGKTTICRSLLDQLPANIDVAFILNPRMSVTELLQTICEEFHITVEQEQPGIKTFVDALNTKLLEAHAQGRSAILIVDEAQNLDPAVLEQLRLLTNLETSTRKLLQIFLIGQPELNILLSRPEMRQVSQRVIARYHLTHLSQSEVKAYVAHRLRVSGASPLIVPETLIKEIYRASGGVPRLINLICDRALLGAYSQGYQQISLPILHQAINEVLTDDPKRFRIRAAVAVLFALVACAAVLFATQSPVTKLKRIIQIGAASTPPAVATIAAPASVTAPTFAVSNVPLDKTVPSPNATLKWPSGMTRSDSEKFAFQSLFKLYGISVDTQTKEAPCHQAEARGMICYAGHGGLSDLFQLDQPVLMRLSSSDGQGYSATLTALDHQTATLMVAGEVQRVTLKELANSWFGEYIVVWNAPPGFDKHIALNDRGPAVAWLRHAMETADGIPDNGSDVFDTPLAKRVRAFQLTDGIQPDGLVGPLTVIRLNVHGGKGGPRLITEKRG